MDRTSDPRYASRGERQDGDPNSTNRNSRRDSPRFYRSDATSPTDEIRTGHTYGPRRERSRHKYQVGQMVSCRFYDWTPEGKTRHCTQVVRVIARIDLPFGYNVESSKPISFLSNVPLPVPTFRDSSDHRQNPTGNSFDQNKMSSRDDVKGNSFDQNKMSSRDDAEGNQRLPNLIEEKDGMISMRFLFVRETDVEANVQNHLLKKMRNFMSRLVFREITAVYTKPLNQIQYINYFAKDGSVSVITDDRKFNTEPDSEKRFSYRVGHFYGFAKPLPGPNYENAETRDVSIHFSMNRFSEIDFWDGVKWCGVDKSKAFRPNKGDIVCGWASRGRDPNAPSYDHWFVCSQQFKNLCYLLCVDGAEERLGWEREVALERLILPENPLNYHIPHEIPMARHLYAAIFSIVCAGVTTLPSEWNLPERKVYQSNISEAFEVWWPARVMLLK